MSDEATIEKVRMVTITEDTFRELHKKALVVDTLSHHGVKEWKGYERAMKNTKLLEKKWVEMMMETVMEVREIKVLVPPS